MGKAEEGMGQNELKGILEEPPTEWAQKSEITQAKLSPDRGEEGDLKYIKKMKLKDVRPYTFGNSIIGKI